MERRRRLSDERDDLLRLSRSTAQRVSIGRGGSVAVVCNCIERKVRCSEPALYTITDGTTVKNYCARHWERRQGRLKKSAPVPEPIQAPAPKRIRHRGVQVFS
jgi:hypothetical protein